jgi:hypothetical protein
VRAAAEDRGEPGQEFVIVERIWTGRIHLDDRTAQWQRFPSLPQEARPPFIHVQVVAMAGVPLARQGSVLVSRRERGPVGNAGDLYESAAVA